MLSVSMPRNSAMPCSSDCRKSVSIPYWMDPKLARLMRRSAGLFGRDPKARLGVESVTQLAVLTPQAGSLLSFQGPADVLADDRRRVLGASRESRDDALVRGRVAESHRHVAQPA